MKNLLMAKWIKQYVKRGLSLQDAQSAARWKAGEWKLSERMRNILASIDELWYGRIIYSNEVLSWKRARDALPSRTVRQKVCAWMAAMVNRGILNFLNQLDEGKRSRRNSFAERVANFLTPNDEFEYRGGLLTNMDGTSAMDRIGEKTSYGTLGQANFAGNDPITSFPNQMPQGTMTRGGLLYTSPSPRD